MTISSADPVVRLRGIRKLYRIYARPMDRLLQSFWRSRRHLFSEHQALKPIDLEVRRGETLGIVGVNGSGKSTLLQIICGTLQPTDGMLETHGRISALLELGAGFNPEFSGRENIYLNAAILGLSRAETERRYDDIVSFSGLDPAMLERPVKTYSSGMYVRLAFAVAIAVEPDILIVDEALAVGDEAFQRKCFARIRQLQERGATILFVSHSARTVVDLCSRAILLDRGELILDASPKLVMEQYHRLIFAPEEQQSLIREHIREAYRNGGERATETVSLEAAVPESRVAYAPRGGFIEEVRLLDLQDRPVQLLTRGEEYRICYRATFDAPCDHLRFATLIKSKTGLELAGGICHAYVRQLQSVQAGDRVDVCFTFVNRLAEGSYFLNCGITTVGVEGERYVHRIIDALQFQVLPDMGFQHGDVVSSAMFDLDMRCELSPVGSD